MKRLIQLLLVVVVFCCGYLLGNTGAPLFPINTAEAVQGPLPISCSVKVDSIICKKDFGFNIAYITISGETWKDFPSPKIYGDSQYKTVELVFE